MQKISILKLENPSCIWGRVICCPTGDSDSTEQYETLQTQMSLFYHDLTQDLHKLKPTSLEEGQVCVVYWSEMKLWCRAAILDSVSSNVRCFLVDRGEQLVVPLEQVWVAVEKFFQLPFWVRRFHLARVRPTTLQVSLCEEKAELIPSTQWDSSSTLYLHNLLQASTRTEAELVESESESTSIELYLTIGNIKICVNDDLVAKKFAYYSRKSADSSRLDEEDRFLLRLTPGILMQTVSATTIKPTSQIQPPPAGAGDPLTVPSTAQGQPFELDTCDGDGERPCPRSQSKESSGSAAGSDSSDDTDSTLEAARTENLSLYRFHKFMNPGVRYRRAASSVDKQEELNNCQLEETPSTSNGATRREVHTESIQLTNKPETRGEDEQLCVSVNGGAAGFLDNSQVEEADEESSGSRKSAESGSQEAEKTRPTKENDYCAQLLEWLNPKPLKSDPDAADSTVVPSDPWRSGILVHSALPVEPCTGLDDAPITDALRSELRRKACSALSAAECYGWPPVARGSNTVVIAQNADQPRSYLIPALTHMLLDTIFCSFTSKTGPIAVLLCPGWEKVQTVHSLLEESKATRPLHPFMVLLGVGKDEAKAVKIPKNCQLLVTTPFSLVRLLSCHCFMFLRVCHLVLDEADQLCALAPDQVATILQHYQKVASREDKPCCPQQIVAVAKQWTRHMEGLLAVHMSHPSIVITVPEEAAIYGNVQQIILMTLESSKISALLDMLDFSPGVGQKTLVVANSAQEVEDVYKAVSNRSAYCLKTHEGLTHQFDSVVQQWRKDFGPRTQVILVTTSECLECLGIRDATCVIHYSFPTSPKLFGGRLFCMAENFRNLSERDQTENCPHLTKSVLLISERNARHFVGLLRYLGRTDAVLPPELLSFAEGIHVAREVQKTDRPLCRYVKSFGVCRDSSVCPDRHRFISQLDQSELPSSGVIEVVPLYIKTASVFCGRIVQKGDGGFDSLVSEMTSFYADKKPGATQLLVGGLYAAQEDDAFHRVKILSVPDREGRLFFSVFVQFIDIGKDRMVKAHQIFQLPEKFQSVPGQAVEIIVCRVKPVDAEVDWHPKATRTISHRIRGLQHRARAVFSLGTSVFVDPMVRVTQVPGTKTLINEYNVQSEILSTGMGVSNPEHLDLLRALCREGEDSTEEAGHISGSGDGSSFLEFRIKEVLAEAFRAAEAKRLSAPPPLEPINQTLGPKPPAPDLHLFPVCVQRPSSDTENTQPSDLGSADQTSPGSLCMSTDVAAVCSTASGSASLKSCENGLPAGGDQNISTNGSNGDDSNRSFHPQVRWYQTSTSVTATVKLTNPESQRCDFYPDRVVYRGKVNGRTYRADLELQGAIVPDRCCWEVKSSEPVLRLVKQQQGNWEKLVRNKNIFVSYDMERIEEDEDGVSCAQWFVQNIGEENSYMNSESDSD